MPYERPRGTRDYLPHECEERRAVLERIRSVFESYGYGEVVTPAFEHLELLVAKAGEEVVDQIYAFTDKAGRKLGLRFELTTPIARIVAENLSLPKPIRFYYIQPVWRYEEPQRGRLREFWQAGVELIGVPGAVGDAEVLAVLINALRRAGLPSFEVHVNDRRLVEALLHWLGVPPELVPSALRVIDKLEKRGVSYVEGELARMVANRDRLKRFIELLSSDPLQAQLPSELPAAAREAVDALEQLLQELDDGYGLAEFVKPDLSVVRGLDYYTSLVYEAKTPLGGELGSVAGGGRYDDLIRLVGGPQMPATGMAIGVERLIEALRAEGALAQRSGRSGYYVIPVAPSFRRYAIRVAEKLRAKGEKAVVEVMGRKLASALEAADKLGFRYAVVIGQREAESGVLTVRDLEAWKEERVPLELLTGS
ncbi:MAG: histidine--tRNA ligase [Thermofilum sp.]|nr:histidine--tRNA ligase [Thermofilum sp.]